VEFRLPRFLQVSPAAKKVLYKIPFLGDVLNVVGETQQNLKAGLSPSTAVSRGLAVGGAGVAASALPPADLLTIAPSVTRYAAKRAADPEENKRRELLRAMGVAGGGASPAALQRTAGMLEYINPESLARTAMDIAEFGRSYALSPEDRVEQIKRELLTDAARGQ
jgi:hypothetical protein